MVDRLMSAITLGAQTAERRREILSDPHVTVEMLVQLSRRFITWEERFGDAALNSRLIAAELTRRHGLQEHSRQSLAVLHDPRPACEQAASFVPDDVFVGVEAHIGL